MFTKEQEDFITEKIKEQWSYAKIANTIGLDRRKVSAWCKQNNLESYNAKTKKSIYDTWAEDKKELFVEMFTKKEYGCYVYTYKDILKIFTDIKDRGTIQNIALKLGYIREEAYKLHSKDLTYEQRKFIIDNNDNMTVQEMARKLNFNDRTVDDFLKSQGITPNRENPKFKKDLMLQIPEFKQDYEDLTLSISYVSNKWNLNEKTVATWRKQDFGDYMYKICATIKRTRPEKEFEDILFDLEIPYFYQWRIDPWKIDYYLGNKICIEIDGSFWHELDNVIEKDKRKIEDLESKGYTVIRFSEEEIYNEKEKVIQKLKEITPFKIKE